MVELGRIASAISKSDLPDLFSKTSESRVAREASTQQSIQNRLDREAQHQFVRNFENEISSEYQRIKDSTVNTTDHYHRIRQWEEFLSSYSPGTQRDKDGKYDKVRADGLSMAYAMSRKNGGDVQNFLNLARAQIENPAYGVEIRPLDRFLQEISDPEDPDYFEPYTVSGAEFHRGSGTYERFARVALANSPDSEKGNLADSLKRRYSETGELLSRSDTVTWNQRFDVAMKAAQRDGTINPLELMQEADLAHGEYKLVVERAKDGVSNGTYNNITEGIHAEQELTENRLKEKELAFVSWVDGASSKQGFVPNAESWVSVGVSLGIPKKRMERFVADFIKGYGAHPSRLNPKLKRQLLKAEIVNLDKRARYISSQRLHTEAQTRLVEEHVTAQKLAAMTQSQMFGFPVGTIMDSLGASDIRRAYLDDMFEGENVPERAIQNIMRSGFGFNQKLTENQKQSIQSLLGETERVGNLQAFDALFISNIGRNPDQVQAEYASAMNDPDALFRLNARLDSVRYAARINLNDIQQQAYSSIVAGDYDDLSIGVFENPNSLWGQMYNKYSSLTGEGELLSDENIRIEIDSIESDLSKDPEWAEDGKNDPEYANSVRQLAQSNIMNRHLSQELSVMDASMSGINLEVQEIALRVKAARTEMAKEDEYHANLNRINEIESQQDKATAAITPAERATRGVNYLSAMYELADIRGTTYTGQTTGNFITSSVGLTSPKRYFSARTPAGGGGVGAATSVRHGIQPQAAVSESRTLLGPQHFPEWKDFNLGADLFKSIYTHGLDINHPIEDALTVGRYGLFTDAAKSASSRRVMIASIIGEQFLRNPGNGVSINEVRESLGPQKAAFANISDEEYEDASDLAQDMIDDMLFHARAVTKYPRGSKKQNAALRVFKRDFHSKYLETVDPFHSETDLDTELRTLSNNANRYFLSEQSRTAAQIKAFQDTLPTRRPHGGTGKIDYTEAQLEAFVREGWTPEQLRDLARPGR